jgi:hypothetical protein
MVAELSRKPRRQQILDRTFTGQTPDKDRTQTGHKPDTNRSDLDVLWYCANLKDSLRKLSSMQPPFIDWRGEWLKAGFDSRSPHCPQILYKGCGMAHSFLQSTSYTGGKKSHAMTHMEGVTYHCGGIGRRLVR